MGKFGNPSKINRNNKEIHGETKEIHRKINEINRKKKTINRQINEINEKIKDFHRQIQVPMCSLSFVAWLRCCLLIFCLVALLLAHFVAWLTSTRQAKAMKRKNSVKSQKNTTKSMGKSAKSLENQRMPSINQGCDVLLLMFLLACDVCCSFCCLVALFVVGAWLRCSLDRWTNKSKY